jgi:plasmid maintenance system antidote protein VapI
MRTRLSELRTLRELLDARGLTMDAAAVLGNVDTATISRICSGQARATPQTVVSLARALGVNARRMARLCDEPWRNRSSRQISNTNEALRQVDIDALAGER